jgi:glutaredoxin 2
MTPEEADQIKEYLNEIIIERSNQRLAPDFINELEVIFKSPIEKNVSVIDQVEQVLSLLRIHAFPVNQKDVANLYEDFSEVLGESVTEVKFVDPITERPISLNDIKECTQEEAELRNSLDLLYPSFENEFDSFRASDNPRKNGPKP